MPLAATGFAVLADEALPVATADLNRSTIWLMRRLSSDWWSSHARDGEGGFLALA